MCLHVRRKTQCRGEKEKLSKKLQCNQKLIVTTADATRQVCGR